MVDMDPFDHFINQLAVVTYIGVGQCESLGLVPGGRLSTQGMRQPLCIVVVTSGSLDLHIAGKMHKVSAGSVVWVPTVLGVESLMPPAEAGCHGLWFVCQPNVVTLSAEPQFFAIGDAVHGLAQDIFAEVRLNDSYRFMRLRAFLILLASDCARSVKRQVDGQRTLSPEQCRRLELYMHAQSNHSVTTGDLAVELGLSQVYAARLMRATYGIAPREWLVVHRLRRAATLLQYTDRTVDDIAQSLGYSQTPLFCRQFRRWYGVTPLAHRLHPQHAQIDTWKRRQRS